MSERIKLSEDQIRAIISGWLKKVPNKVWDKWIEHRILQHYKRTTMDAPRLDGEIAAFPASEMARLDFEVTHPKGENIFAGIGTKSRSG